MGNYNSRIGEASKLNENIGQYIEVTKIRNVEKMLKFLEHNEMKTLDGREKKAEPDWTRQCKQKEESSIVDFKVAENGKKMEVGKKQNYTCMRQGRRNYGSLSNMDRQSIDKEYQIRGRKLNIIICRIDR